MLLVYAWGIIGVLLVHGGCSIGMCLVYVLVLRWCIICGICGVRLRYDCCMVGA